MALSVKTQIYIVLVLLAIIFIVIPLFRYLMAKTYATIDPIKFELQHVMIVGASDGLGKELVREVFMKGALVTMIGRDEKKLKEIRDELDFNTQGDPLIRYFKADITVLESYEVEKLIKKAEGYLGSVEMIIFCAAKSEPVMFISSDLNKFKSHMDLNFFCVVKFLIPVAKRMVIRKTQGRICIIGDPIGALKTIPGMTAYSCSKSALEQLAL